MGFSVEDTVWITLADGTRLAARVWMPEGQGPFPAVLEFLPYRRRDGTSQRDKSTYPAFAEAGIAGVRVDTRDVASADRFCCDLLDVSVRAVEGDRVRMPAR